MRYKHVHKVKQISTQIKFRYPHDGLCVLSGDVYYFNRKKQYNVSFTFYLDDN